MTLPNDSSHQSTTGAEAKHIASQFVKARQRACPLSDFPGVIPVDLDTAYEIQNAAIDLCAQRALGGWKVGRIPPAIEDTFGIDRLAGPIFADTIVHADSGAVLDMPIFEGGFAAIEAEFVAVVDRDAPADKLVWSPEESLDMVADLRIGLEIASSPLATINDMGPPVVVADHGNNFGLVVGPSIKNWRTRSLDTMRCRTCINNLEVGTGGAFTLTGGFVRSVQFLLELAARRGRPLRAGDMIATGQTTGIHDVKVGETGTTDFGDDGMLSVSLVAATNEE